MLVNAVYMPSCPTAKPAGFQNDVLVYLSQFHSGRTPGPLENLAAHSIRANALSVLQCRRSVAASLRETAWDPDATAEKDSCSSRTFLRSCTRPPKTPAKCSCHRSSRSSSPLVRVRSILCSLCQRSHIATHAVGVAIDRQTLRLLGVPLQECQLVGDENAFHHSLESASLSPLRTRMVEGWSGSPCPLLVRSIRLQSVVRFLLVIARCKNSQGLVAIHAAQLHFILAKRPHSPAWFASRRKGAMTFTVHQVPCEIHGCRSFRPFTPKTPLACFNRKTENSSASSDTLFPSFGANVQSLLCNSTHKHRFCIEDRRC